MQMRLIALAFASLALVATAVTLTGVSSDAVAQTKPLSDGPGGCERDKPTPTTS